MSEGRPDETPSAVAPARRWSWLVAALGPAILWLPIVFGRVLMFRDILSFFAPYHAFAAQGLRQGRLPQWNPHLFGGMPFLADPQSAVFYPPSALFLALPPEWAATVFVLLHLPVAGLGAYALGRALKLSEPFAAAAGLGYATSGYLLGLHDNPTFISAAALFPVTVALLVRLAERPSGRRAVAAAIFVGLMILNGEPQTVAFACAVGLLLGIAIASARLRALVSLLAATGLGAALGLVQLLPTLIYSRSTIRSAGIPFEEASTIALYPLRLVEFLVASPLGTPFPENGFWGADLVNSANHDPWSYCLFLGPALVLPALGARWSKLTAPFKVLAVLVPAALLLALGPYLPFFRLWHALVPFADRFRTPEKWCLLASLGLVFLSAFELERMAKEGARLARLCFAVAIVFVLLCVAASFESGPLWRAVESGLAKQPYAIAPAAAMARLLTTLSLSGLCCAALGIILYRAQKGRAALLSWPLWTLLLSCSIWSGWNSLSYGVAKLSAPSIVGQIRALTPPGAAGRFIRDETCLLGGKALGEGEGSLLERTPRWYSETGFGTLPMLFGLSTDVGYVAAAPAQQLAVRRRVGQGPGGAYRWARLAGGSVRLGCDRDGYSVVSALSSPLPRVAVLPVRVEATPERVLDLLDDPSFDFARAALVSDPVAVTTPDPTLPAPIARVVEENPERIRVEVQGQGGLLVLADSFADGWSATVDAASAPVVRANAIQRGVPVPPGRHEVVFRYTAPGLVVGGIASLVALLACGVLLALGQRGRSKSETPAT